MKRKNKPHKKKIDKSIFGLQVSFCHNRDSLWVQIDGPKKWEGAPFKARQLADILIAAADYADNWDEAQETK